MNRFSKDQDAIDNQIATAFRFFVMTLSSAISPFCLIMYATPIFGAPLFPVLVSLNNNLIGSLLLYPKYVSVHI